MLVLSCSISDLRVTENHQFIPTPVLFKCHRSGWPLSNFGMNLITANTGSSGYPSVKKSWRWLWLNRCGFIFVICWKYRNVFRIRRKLYEFLSKVDLVLHLWFNFLLTLVHYTNILHLHFTLTFTKAGAASMMHFVYVDRDAVVKVTCALKLLMKL